MRDTCRKFSQGGKFPGLDEPILQQLLFFEGIRKFSCPFGNTLLESRICRLKLFVLRLYLGRHVVHQSDDCVHIGISSLCDSSIILSGCNLIDTG